MLTSFFNMQREYEQHLFEFSQTHQALGNLIQLTPEEVAQI